MIAHLGLFVRPWSKWTVGNYFCYTVIISMGISMMMMRSKPKGSRNRCEPSVLHILLAKITKRREDEHLQFSLILLSALDDLIISILWVYYRNFLSWFCGWLHWWRWPWIYDDKYDDDVETHPHGKKKHQQSKLLVAMLQCECDWLQKRIFISMMIFIEEPAKKKLAWMPVEWRAIFITLRILRMEKTRISLWMSAKPPSSSSSSTSPDPSKSMSFGNFGSSPAKSWQG